ncbi:MBL fold metallo-hydrolase [Allorhizobium taibaishanense]|uniref:quorum-quenching N-acyl-homoserine lactonase n=1 Tax=Allorhizobium taibaishanense TaxID=887144 RepID=A0A7W6HQZ2_9HYPH|nr:MBL fold metallo-hydrolase [Allorhizobium taibaishanense]MBB4009805.1 glyoxylase-like metal-dependent hydrolase (beta-lactamase superfamily II) [Allorhizobium taibaishanense]
MMVEPRFFTTSILPVREWLLLRHGSFKRLPLRVRVGYFHHPQLGHTLIDTGYCNADALRRLPQDPLLAAYRLFLRPSTLSNDPLGAGLSLLDLRKQDIETIIITHFHADHIGGLRDLPGAQLLCARQAWNAYRNNSATKNAMSGVFAGLMPDDIENRLHFFEDFHTVPAPGGLGTGWDIAADGSVLAIDLPGHLDGHVGLCFPGTDAPLLYATDAQWLIRAIIEDRLPGFPAGLVCHDRPAMQSSAEKVRAFFEQGGDIMLCHDPEGHRLDMDNGVKDSS